MKIVKGDETIVVDQVKDGEVYLRKFRDGKFVMAWRMLADEFVDLLIVSVRAGARVLG